MKARIILNCLMVTTLLGSHTVFANPYAETQDKTAQEPAGNTASGVEVEAVTTNLMKMLNYDNHAEIVQRVIMESRQQLSQQLGASSLLLEALKLSESYLKLSIGNIDVKPDLTAR
jgi:hypothetical protein